MIKRVLRKTDSGATAIEYALIAGLIGLGLIGSLVTTKGSLNAIFGVASSQMGSSGAGSAGSPSGPSAATQPPAQYWPAKGTPTRTVQPFTTNTLTGGSVTGTRITLTYPDGSTVNFYTAPNSISAYRAITTDVVTGETIYSYINDSGQMNFYRMVTSDPATGEQTSVASAYVTGTNSYGQATYQAFSGSPPQPINEIYVSCSGGQCSNQTPITPTQEFVGQVQRGFQQVLYFKTLLN